METFSATVPASKHIKNLNIPAFYIVRYYVKIKQSYCDM
jgi:hypothetical protein